MYSLLAGFVEPGETLEAAVRREVFEEAGIEVSEVDYLASQPWPFPASLMIGCQGRATSREINLDPVEIEDARWVSREAMADVLAGLDETMYAARKGSIARFLIEHWLADRLD
jgi:NAD+ diphosphatase